MRDDLRLTEVEVAASEILPWIWAGGRGERDLDVERELWAVDLPERTGIWIARERRREDKL